MDRNELHQYLQKFAAVYFGIQLKACLKAFQQALFNAAEQAKTNQEQGLYFDALKVLRDQTPVMSERFQQKLGENIQAYLQGHALMVNAGAVDTIELALVDHEVLEDELATSVISARCASRLVEPLWKLNRRLSVLRGGRKVDDENNPVGPQQLCVAGQFCLSPLEFSRKPKLLFYKLFEKTVLAKAEEFYNKLNQHFIEKGLLPNLKYELVRAATGTSPVPPEAAAIPPERAVDAAPPVPGSAPSAVTAPAGGYIPSVAAQQSEVRQQDLMGSIRSLQSVMVSMPQGLPATIMVTAGRGQDAFNERDYALALSMVQDKHGLPPQHLPVPVDEPEAVEKHFFEQLGKQKQQSRRDKIARGDIATVELVGNIFRCILDDPELSDSVKAILSHLHTPVLKVALMDRRFLDQPGHPVRRLLNVMTDLASLWGKDAAGEKLVLPRLRSVTDRILKDFVDDLAMFDQMLLELRDFADEMRRRADAVEQRNLDAARGMEKLADARGKCRAALAEHLGLAPVSAELTAQVFEPWTDYLAFVCLRFGDSSTPWFEALAVVDGLVQCLNTGRVESASFGPLRAQLRHGLTTVGGSAEGIEQVLGRLPELLMQAAGQRQEHTAEVPTPKAVTEVETKPWLKSLQGLVFGTWYKVFVDDTPEPVKLKLAWYSEVSDRYMFVSQSGVRALIMNGEELALKLANGRAEKVVEDERSFMERLLERVLDRFRVAA